MGLLTMDKEKCKKDGLCAADCPINIIHFEDSSGYPALIPDGDAVCLRCGHCVAVCPHGALDHADVSLAGSPLIDKTLVVSEGQVEQFLRSRRSIRVYDKRPVARETMQRLIEIARYAPTGSNSQMVEWIVINERERLDRICEMVVDWMRRIVEKTPQLPLAPYVPRLVDAWDTGLDVILRGSPCLVVAMAPVEALNGMVDLSIALSYLELAAPSLGLGSCWAGIIQMALTGIPTLKTEIGIPDKYPHHYPMMVGHPHVKYHRLPERKSPHIIWR